MDMFIILRVVIVSWVYTYDKTHQVIYYKYVLIKAVKKKAGTCPCPLLLLLAQLLFSPPPPTLRGGEAGEIEMETFQSCCGSHTSGGKVERRLGEKADAGSGLWACLGTSGC